MQSDKFRLEDATLPDRYLGACVSSGKWKSDANALCSFDHVSVRHDVTIGIDDHARSHSMLPDDESGLGAVFLFKRTVSRTRI